MPIVDLLTTLYHFNRANIVFNLYSFVANIAENVIRKPYNIVSLTVCLCLVLWNWLLITSLPIRHKVPVHPKESTAKSLK